MSKTAVEEAGYSGQIAMPSAPMIGHGLLMILAALVGGLFLQFFLIGGMEVLGQPGHVIAFSLPGTEAAWRNTHTGPLLNGLMVIGIALGVPHLRMSDRMRRILELIMICDGWANTGFYFFAVFSPNRAQGFGTTRMGVANIFSWLALT